MGRSLEQRLAVLRGQVRHEPGQAAEMQATVSEHREQRRMAARRASNGDAPVGLGLREVQVLGAVRKHRRECPSGIEPSLVDLAEMGDEIGLDAVRLRDELSETAEQLCIGDGLKRARDFGIHACNIGRASSASS